MKVKGGDDDPKMLIQRPERLGCRRPPPLRPRGMFRFGSVDQSYLRKSASRHGTIARTPSPFGKPASDDRQSGGSDRRRRGLRPIALLECRQEMPMRCRARWAQGRQARSDVLQVSLLRPFASDLIDRHLFFCGVAVRPPQALGCRRLLSLDPSAKVAGMTLAVCSSSP